MEAEERRARILDDLGRDGAVRVRRLVERLGVSDMTVRRDLHVLHQHGLLDKVHGGAVAAIPTHRLDDERAIAARAASFARPGTAVALAASTTTLALARHLVEVPDLTVVTNSVRVADTLHRAATATVVLTGGLRTAPDALVGPLAVGALGSLHVDVVFLGVRGMDEAAGFSSPDLLQAETHRAMVACGDRLVVVAASSRWGVTGLSSIVALSDADVVVTDGGLPQHARRVLANHVGEISYVTADPGDEVGR